MRYLIQIHDRANLIDDNDVDGIDTFAEARSEALRVAGELLHDRVWGIEDHGRCFIRILNQHRQVVCTVDLWEAIVASAFIDH